MVTTNQIEPRDNTPLTEEEKTACRNLFNIIFGTRDFDAGCQVDYSRALMQTIDSLIANLTPKQTTVLRGMVMYGKSKKEMAAELHDRPSRVVNVLAMALRHMRHPRSSRQLRPFYKCLPREPEN